MYGACVRAIRRCQGKGFNWGKKKYKRIAQGLHWKVDCLVKYRILLKKKRKEIRSKETPMQAGGQGDADQAWEDGARHCGKSCGTIWGCR